MWTGRGALKKQPDFPQSLKVFLFRADPCDECLKNSRHGSELGVSRNQSGKLGFKGQLVEAVFFGA
jgi:hypothetical protein